MLKPDSLAHEPVIPADPSRPPTWVPLSLEHPARGLIRLSLMDMFFERSSHWHWHPRVQVMVPLVGVLVVHLRGRDDLVVRPMHAALIPANLWHMPDSSVEGERVLTLDMRIATEPANDLHSELGETHEPRVWPCHPPTLRRSLAELRRLNRQGDAASGAAIMRAAWGLLVTAAPGTPGEAPLGDADAVDRRILYVEKQMRTDLAREYHAETFAATIQVSVSQMTRLFKQHRGVSPLRRLQTLRLEQAEQYLTYSTMSIKQITGRCGFTSPDHFARLFKERTGQSPREYRQAHQPAGPT